MLRKILISSGLMLATVGCGYSEDAFISDYSQAYCAKLEECEMLELMQFDSVDACVDAFEAAADGDDSEDECDFQGDMGKACVEETESASCDSWDTPSCAEVCG